MKNFRGTLITVFLGLLLGAYIYFFERAPLKPKDEGTKTTKVFENFVADDIDEIRLENLGTTVTAEKSPLEIRKDEKGVWQILSPQKMKADESMVRTLLAGVGDFNPESSLENPANLADFGLNSPNARSTFRTKAGLSFQLALGDKNPAGTLTYCKSAAKNTLFLLPVSSVDALRQNFDHFRDHTFLKTDMVLAQRVRITHGKKILELEKDKDNAWRVTLPLQARAEESKVRDLLNSLNGLRAEGFARDGAVNLAPYGLLRPAAKVEVWPSDKGPVKSILLGKKKDKTSSYYVKAGEGATVCLVGEFFANQLDFKINEYRDKSVMKFDSGAVQSVTVTRNGNATLYTKGDKGLWTAPGRDKAPEEVASIISQLSQLVIQDFAAEGAPTGLDHPTLSVDIALADGTLRRYRFGNRDQGQVYLASDRNKDVYRVPATLVSLLESYFNTVLTPIPVASTVPPPKK